MPALPSNHLMTHRVGTQAKSLDISLPATSANLGPAFDAAALAFALFVRVRAKTADEFDAHALADFFGAADVQTADLAGAPNMGATAGVKVEVGDADEADGAEAVGQLAQRA